MTETRDDGEAVLDGFTDVPWAARAGRVYTLTRDVSLTRLTIEEGAALGGDFALHCDELVNHGTIYGEVAQASEIRNDGLIDPQSMRRWS